MPTHAISFFSSVSNYSVLLWRKTAAKVQPFSKLPKYFFKKINGVLSNDWKTDICSGKNFSSSLQNSLRIARNTLLNAKKRPFLDTMTHKFAQNQLNTMYYRMLREKLVSIHGKRPQKPASRLPHPGLAAGGAAGRPGRRWTADCQKQGEPTDPTNTTF